MQKDFIVGLIIVFFFYRVEVTAVCSRGDQERGWFIYLRSRHKGFTQCQMEWWEKRIFLGFVSLLKVGITASDSLSSDHRASGKYSRESTITDCEDVSYVSSPFLPANLRARGSRATASNAARAHLSSTVLISISTENAFSPYWHYALGHNKYSWRAVWSNHTGRCEGSQLSRSLLSLCRSDVLMAVTDSRWGVDSLWCKSDCRSEWQAGKCRAREGRLVHVACGSRSRHHQLRSRARTHLSADPRLWAKHLSKVWKALESGCSLFCWYLF